MPTKDEMNNFSMAIETLAREKDMPFMDAIIEHCTNSGLEIEVAAKLISTSLKAKIKLEAEELHFLPKSNTAKLPV
jgi:hypothetical protein